MCALLLAKMITRNKLSHKLNVSLHRSKCPSSPLPMHQTSSWSDKSSSPDEKMMDNKCALPPYAFSLLEVKAKTPWKYSPCNLQAAKSLSSISQGFYSNPHEVHPPSPEEMRPSPLLQKSQVKNESPKYLYPLFSLLMSTLKYQWLRLNLAKSNQWVRSIPIISLRKPTFLGCFMSINSPTLWINCHFMT